MSKEKTKQFLAIASTIIIKRSDGRTHAAVVSSIDYDLCSVKVEWFEGGETKGKEIDFGAVISLNSNISVARPGVTSKQEKFASSTPSSAEFKQRVSLIPSHSRTQSAKPRLTQNPLPTISLTQNSLTHVPSSSASSLIVTGTKISAVKTSRSTYESFTPDVTLKKLEKLEKDRVERRKKQAEIRAEKDQFFKKCQGNPHYELVKMITEYCKKVQFKPLTTNESVQERLINVVVRKRPLNTADYAKREVDIITIPSKNQLIVHEPKLKVDLTKYLENHVFKFDYTFNETCSNVMVYKYTAQPLVKTIFEGGFATCFAYGQTGSGKTYTMSGNYNELNADKGIYALTAADIFKYVRSTKYNNFQFVVSCSFFEIYTKKVFDLLNKKNSLKILEDGKQQIQIVGLTEKIVNSVEEVLELIRVGNIERASGQTSANSNSSRSHAIFQIYLRSKAKMKVVHGKFSLIDLAGNERGADTFSSSKITRMEGAEINQSLLALKECIRALGRKGSHLPFRACKLTQVLKDSFVGINSKTCMIAIISPGVSSCENTLNTLRYADRVKELGSGDIRAESESPNQWKDESITTVDVQEIQTDANEKTQLLKIDRTVINSHRETVAFLKNILKNAEDLATDEFSYKKWNNILESGITCMVNAKEIVEEALVNINV